MGQDNVSVDVIADNAAANASAAASLVAKRTKNPRNNHAAAKSHPIVDSASAMAFCQQAMADTDGDTASTGMNASGFVNPHSIANFDDDAIARSIVMAQYILASRRTPQAKAALAITTAFAADVEETLFEAEQNAAIAAGEAAAAALKARALAAASAS